MAAFFIPGGTPEPGETLAETAAREVAEKIAWFTAADADRCAPAILQLIARLADSGRLASR